MKPRIWKNYYDVVILPPQKVRDYAIALSKSFKKRGAEWTLGRKQFLPHISLYHIPVKTKDFPRFISEIKNIAARVKTGNMKSTGIELMKSNFLFLTFNKPKWLEIIHYEIIKNLRKYLDKNYGVEKIWNIKNLPQEKQKVARELLKKYGSPVVGVNYKSHISLTKFKEEPALEKSEIKIEIQSFKPDALYVCELGPSYSCQKIVAKINF